jgi:hypothetical protein
VVAWEQELWEKKEDVTSTLERGRSELSSHEVDLDTRTFVGSPTLRSHLMCIVMHLARVLEAY